MLEAVTGAPDRAVLNLRVGGVCLMVGAVLFATVRLLHGDTPAAPARAPGGHRGAVVRRAGWPAPTRPADQHGAAAAR